ncbi:RNA polymerase sigma factor [Nonomuraea soli]|uniref:RNA polymerase sigma factor (Sigma-70 family) n=1 Tax=Nonomuraea soli TaxID=1032476 RepID=A0A7W0CSD6_9ACTN|nr:sigma-70 family RNA polymerase sigma factor [Nonomuraea soli]MBA2896343.1 RNA polymerase sigma factor (sigma-70 family) [Nonomuraea soli]
MLANHFRGENRRQARTVELDAELSDLYAAAPEQGVEVAAIGEVFRALGDDDRELLALVAWEGLDREQIAAAMGLSRNAVRIRLHRARKRFARALAAAGVRGADQTLQMESSL